MANYIQPDYRVPPNIAGVSVQPHQPGARSGNPLNLSAPVPAYVQPGTTNPAPITNLAGPMGTSKNGPFG